MLRNDRVVATSTTTSATVPGVSGGDRFFVRAVDSWGNRSASTPVTTATAGVATTTLVPAGCHLVLLLRQHHAGRRDVADRHAARWATGAAPLGWGTGPIATNIDVPAGQTRALTSYYRRSFTVADPGAFKTVKLTTRADDGVAVYVNGTEVGRSNLPAGALTASTYASSAPNTATAIANEVTFDVPGLAAARRGQQHRGRGALQLPEHAQQQHGSPPDRDLMSEQVAARPGVRGAYHAARQRAEERRGRALVHAGGQPPARPGHRLGRCADPVDARPHDRRELRVVPRRGSPAGGGLARPWRSAIGATLLLQLGFAFDSADGQLARLRGGGSPAGEWLDHVVDSGRHLLFHLAVLIGLYRFADVPDAVLLIPLAFGLVSTVRFFAQILAEQLARRDPVAGPDSVPRFGTWIQAPADTGLLNFVVLLWPLTTGFLWAYGVMGALNALLLAATLVRRHRELAALARGSA